MELNNNVPQLDDRQMSMSVW